MEETPFPGEFGFLALEYTGNAPGVRLWRGAVTGVPYRFGKDQRVGLVDARDAIRFILQRTANGAVPVWRPFQGAYFDTAG